jgi:hypothetical protein
MLKRFLFFTTFFFFTAGINAQSFMSSYGGTASQSTISVKTNILKSYVDNMGAINRSTRKRMRQVNAHPNEPEPFYSYPANGGLQIETQRPLS